MITRRGVMWASLALLGIVLTAGLTWSVARLAGQHIGLSGANFKVVRGLAPPVAASPARPAAHRRQGAGRPKHSTRTVTRTGTAAPSPTVTPSPPVSVSPAPATSVTPAPSASAPSGGTTSASPSSGTSKQSSGGDGSGDSGSSSGGSADNKSGGSGSSTHRDD